MGGHWHPEHCHPRQRLGIFVPMKRRWHQLPIFLRHLHQVLVSQWRHYTIFVVEQAGNIIRHTKHLKRILNFCFRRGSFQPREITQRRCRRSLKNPSRFGLLHLARRRHATRDQFRRLQMPRRPPIRPSNGHLSEQKGLPVIIISTTSSYISTAQLHSSSKIPLKTKVTAAGMILVTLQLVRWH